MYVSFVIIFELNAIYNFCLTSFPISEHFPFLSMHYIRVNFDRNIFRVNHATSERFDHYFLREITHLLAIEKCKKL
jgi:hypothetical protein